MIEGVLPYVVFAAGLAAVMYGMWLFARFARRRGVDGALMSIADDLYHPAAKEQQEEHRVEEERIVPRPSPSDL
jgi:hypothetical protein